jgi:hypothetical protein
VPREVTFSPGSDFPAAVRSGQGVTFSQSSLNAMLS